MSSVTKIRLAEVIAVSVVLILSVAAYLGRDLWIRRPHPLGCGDGQRYTIDTRQFATQYSEYSLQLKASLDGKGKISVKLDPVQEVKLSEAMQSANEFRKYVVAGFNSCAITKIQFGQMGARYQTLDNLAREINQIAARPTRSAEEDSQLANLINQYVKLTNSLGTD